MLCAWKGPLYHTYGTISTVYLSTDRTMLLTFSCRLRVVAPSTGLRLYIPLKAHSSSARCLAPGRQVLSPCACLCALEAARLACKVVLADPGEHCLTSAALLPKEYNVRSYTYLLLRVVMRALWHACLFTFCLRKRERVCPDVARSIPWCAAASTTEVGRKGYGAAQYHI
jgi:hypothetical protein